MPTFTIEGAMRETGQDVVVPVDAADRDDAARQAVERNILVTSIQELRGTASMADILSPVMRIVAVFGLLAGVVGFFSIADLGSDNARNAKDMFGVASYQAAGFSRVVAAVLTVFPIVAMSLILWTVAELLPKIAAKLD